MPDSIDVTELNLAPRDPPYFYLSTLQAATASFHSVFASFTGPKDSNLIINKGTRIEVYEVVASGLLPKLEIPIMGRISVMKSFRPTSMGLDLLACLTEKGDFFVLAFNQKDNEIVTLLHANMKSADCVPSRNAQLLSIDERAQLIAIHVCVGIIHLISYDIQGDSVHFKKSVPVKLMELDILDLTFVDAVKGDSSAPATLAVLHRMPMKLARVKTYEIIPSASSYSLPATAYALTELTNDVIGLQRVAKPRGGFLVYSPERIIYTNPAENLIRKLIFTPTFFTCCAPIDDDGFRFLFGSSAGDLYILLLMPNKELKCEKLGQLAIPSCITYIDDGVCFAGSAHGDSSLIQLCSEMEADGNFFKTIQTFPSLAPMTDFCVIKPNAASEQVALIGACGSAKQGSLRRLTSGIEVHCTWVAEIGDEELLPTALHCVPAGVHQLISLSGGGQTNILVLEEGMLSDFSSPILKSKSESLAIYSLSSGALCQILSNSILVTSPNRDRVIQSINTGDKQIVLTSCCSGVYLLVAMKDGEIILFGMGSSGALRLFSFQLDLEIAAIHALQVKDNIFSALFALWDGRTCGWLEYHLKENKANIQKKTIPSLIRSISVLDNRYALFGSGDGQVFVNELADWSAPMKEIKIGAEPVKLMAFNGTSVLAQTPTAITQISLLNGRIVHSVWLGLVKDISAACVWQNGLLVASGKELRYYRPQEGNTPLLPRVHIETHKIGESIHRLTHLPHSNTLASLQHSFPILAIPSTHWPNLASRVCLYDAQSLKEVDSFPMQSGEVAWCCCSGSVEGVFDREVLIVGTCIFNPSDKKSEQGRLLVFRLGEGRKLERISLNEISNGGVKAVSIVNGAVVAAIRGQTVLFKWDYAVEKRLVKASSSGGHIEGTCFDVRDNIVAIGDALTSVSFCHVKDGKISEFGRDFQDNYVTSVRLIDHASAVASDLTGNLLTLQVIRDENLKMSAAICAGNIHLGDMINSIRAGDFLTKPADALQSLLAVSAAGGLYSLHQITLERKNMLEKLQKNLLALIRPIGGIKHNEFRRFFNGDRSLKASSGFIDGDLVGRFASLSEQRKLEAMGLMKGTSVPEKITEVSVDQMTRIVESLSFGI